MNSENMLSGIILPIITMILVGGLSYYLSKDKSNTPAMLGLIGVVFSVIPPIGVIYLIFIALNMKNKPVKNTNQNNTNE